MPSIIKKYQKCGKINCHCSSNESYHGPYFWSVRYIRPRNSLKKGKYKWQYVGKNEEELNKFLNKKSSVKK